MRLPAFVSAGRGRGTARQTTWRRRAVHDGLAAAARVGRRPEARRDLERDLPAANLLLPCVALADGVEQQPNVLGRLERRVAPALVHHAEDLPLGDGEGERDELARDVGGAARFGRQHVDLRAHAAPPCACRPGTLASRPRRAARRRRLRRSSAGLERRCRSLRSRRRRRRPRRLGGRSRSAACSPDGGADKAHKAPETGCEVTERRCEWSRSFYPPTRRRPTRPPRRGAPRPSACAPSGRAGRAAPSRSRLASRRPPGTSADPPR